MKTLVDFNKGLMSLPMPGLVWLGLLVVVNLAAPIYFFETLEAKVVQAAFLASGALMVTIFASRGFVRLLGIAHIFWVPMIPWLLTRLDQFEPGDPIVYWMVTVIVMNSISLIFDAIDLVRYINGERQPYIDIS